VIVRWGLASLEELAGDAPLVVASPRWRGLPLEAGARWEEVPSARVQEAAALACDRVDW
jgi:hypothetical protein